MQAAGAPTMILPKVRAPRFVTIRRGGTLTDSDHRLLALWAASCAEHVLDLFESAQHEDPRPRQAIEHARAWVRGEVNTTRARAAGGRALGAARDLRGPARHAAYAAGQAWGRRTRRRARARCGRLCDQGRTCCRAGRRGRGGRATRVPVAARPAPGGDSRARTRRPAVAERHLLVGVRLLRARRPLWTLWHSATRSKRPHADFSAMMERSSRLGTVYRVVPGGAVRIVGTYSSSWMRLSNVRLPIMSRATSG